jgi:lauroyl/myristoyl acyltransferase
MPSREAVAPRPPDAGSSAACSSPDRAPLFTLNDLFWLVYLYPLRLLSDLIPPAWLRCFGKLAVPVFQFQARKARKRATRRILALRPGIPPAQAARIARQCISNDLFRQLDSLVLLRASRRLKLRCTGIEGIEHLDRAIAEGRGVMLLTLHFCATRIAVRYLATRGYPMLCVQNHVPQNFSEGRLGSMLGRRYMELRSRTLPDVAYLQDVECGLQILRRLRSGGLVLMQMDGLTAKTIVEGPFFGAPWRFSAGPLDVVRYSNCTVLPMLCLGGSARFRVRFGPKLVVAKASSREEFARANLSVFTSVLEQQVAEHPEEWRGWTWN